MRKIKLKFFVGILAFILGIIAVALFTYRALKPENVNNQEIQTVENKQSEPSEEELVYLAVLNDLFLKDNVKLLVISNQTRFYSNPDYLKEIPFEQRFQDMKKYYVAATDDTLKDFDSKMRQSLKLNFIFELPVKYIFINKEEVSKGKEGGIIAFSKKYPDAEGMIEFSAVGFNEEKNQAFVRVDFIYCPLCGFGNSILLEKINDNWKIVKNYGGWVS
jgi:hypothetical protein